MKEYIEKEAAVENFMQYTWYNNFGEAIDDSDEKREILDDMFSDIPAADVRPVIRGEWIKQEPYNQNYWKCSNCGETNKYAYRDGDVTIYELQDFFCPNCGAQMDGGVDK